MQESQFTNYDELPLFLSAKLVAQTLGVGRATAYELMNEKDFPAIRVGSRIVVPKDKFRQWVEQQTGGASEVPAMAQTRYRQVLFQNAQ